MTIKASEDTKAINIAIASKEISCLQLWSTMVYNTRKATKEHIQLRTHQWVQSTSYVCTERIFTGLLFTFNKLFFKDFKEKRYETIWNIDFP